MLVGFIFRSHFDPEDVGRMWLRNANEFLTALRQAQKPLF
jgi:hypothetical protein